MRMIIKNKKKGKKKYFIIIIVTIIGVFISGMIIDYYSNKALPTILAYAEAETKKLTILVINRAVTKQIYTLDTEDIFDVKYNSNGEIILIDFNSKSSSKILSTMTSLVELNLRAIEEGRIDMLELPDNNLNSFNKELLEKGVIVEVPFGIITGSNMLYNIGPKIPVKLSFVGDVVTGFSTEVIEYGINNALIKLMIDIKVDTKIILPVTSKELTIDCSIPIAMKVIQGKIPDYYMNGFTSKSGVVGEN